MGMQMTTIRCTDESGFLLPFGLRLPSVLHGTSSWRSTPSLPRTFSTTTTPWRPRMLVAWHRPAWTRKPSVACGNS